LHHPNPDSAVFCEMHEKWLVGENQVRQHYLEHISTNTLATMSTNERQVTCPFCYVNQNLTPLDRAKTFAGGAYGSILQHLRTQHLDDLSGNTLLCPVCDLECFSTGQIDEVINHLLGHGYHTSLKNPTKCYPKRKRE
jgi:hypothetical protein